MTASECPVCGCTCETEGTAESLEEVLATRPVTKSKLLIESGLEHVKLKMTQVDPEDLGGLPTFTRIYEGRR